jgi:hypothetical protein
MLAAVVFRSEGNKSHLALQARHSRSSIVLLVLAVLLAMQKAECNRMVVKRTVAVVEVSWRRSLLWQISKR